MEYGERDLLQEQGPIISFAFFVCGGASGRVCSRAFLGGADGPWARA
nr:MAG TPA: hypothetical protein [Caudoviricetes sp.]